jgi:hypothetical protein
VGFLVAATWAYQGYRYNTWPQPGFLANVLRLSGDLPNDWYTSFPPAHWAVDHTLALVPHSLLPAAVLLMWLLSLTILWGSFVSICDSLGGGLLVAVAAGLILMGTRIEAFGVSQILFDFFYPNLLSFALAVASLALLLRSRFIYAGAALGLAVLVHPGLGPLAVAVLAPVAVFQLRSGGRFDCSGALRFAVPLIVLGVPPLAELMLDQSAGSSLTAHQQYEFLAVVREPHHLLYRAFTEREYVQSGLWITLLIGALATLWHQRAARALGVLMLAIALLCAAGAVASEHGSPLLLVTAQTSRLSALPVFLAPVAVGASLCRWIGSRWATAGLLAVFLIAPSVSGILVRNFPAWGGLSAAEAILILVLGALAIVAVALQVAPRLTEGAASLPPVAGAASTWIVALAFLGTVVSLGVEHDSRVSPYPDAELALKDVASVAKSETLPGELVLGSPNYDGQRVYSERPDVVEFGSVKLGEGDAEWRRRIVELTGDPRILDPNRFGSNLPARLAQIDADYLRTISSSLEPICRYHARMVIAPKLTSPVPWLRRVYGNRLLSLYRVSGDPCHRASPGA